MRLCPKIQMIVPSSGYGPAGGTGKMKI